MLIYNNKISKSLSYKQLATMLSISQRSQDSIWDDVWTDLPKSKVEKFFDIAGYVVSHFQTDQTNFFVHTYLFTIPMHNKCNFYLHRPCFINHGSLF